MARCTMVSGRLSRLAWLGALAFAALPASGEPLCRVRARIEPGGGLASEAAVVGQALLFSLEIEQRRDVSQTRFQPALSFPAFRVEWLPTENLPDPDEGWRAYRERRVLIPGYAGRLRIPDIGLLCETSGASELVRVTGLAVEIRSPPEQGRPEDWSGLIGPIELGRTVTPEHVQLGGSIRVSVRIAGPANIWLADPGLEPMLPSELADVFVHPPENERDAGRELRFRRYLSYDLVPRKAGSLVLPALRIAYYDPATGSYGHATLAERTVTVAAPAGASAAERPAEATPRTEPKRNTEQAPAPSLAVVAAVLGAGLVALGFWWRRRIPRAPDLRTRLRADLAKAETALLAGELEQAALLLCAAARAGIADAAPGEVDAALRESAEELLTRVEDLSAARPWALLLQRLERARFSGDPDAAELRAAHAEALALARGVSS